MRNQNRKHTLPTHDAFSHFFSLIHEKYSAQRVSEKQVLNWLASDEPKKPLSAYKRKQTGIETCYEYVKSGSPYKVIMWTSYVAEEKSARGSDAAWVIIIDRTADDLPVYFSFPALD